MGRFGTQCWCLARITISVEFGVIGERVHPGNHKEYRFRMVNSVEGSSGQVCPLVDSGAIANHPAEFSCAMRLL